MTETTKIGPCPSYTFCSEEDDFSVPVMTKIMGGDNIVWMTPESAVRYKQAQTSWEALIRAERCEAEAALLEGPAETAVDKIETCLFNVGSEARLALLLELCGAAPGAVFWPIFLTMWTGCDRTWRSGVLPALRRQAKKESPLMYFDAEQRAAYDALPDVLTVYRGCSRPRIKGVSWTLDKEVAQRFAKGHRGIPVPEPVVACRRIAKAGVFGVFLGRNETEIVLDSALLRVVPGKR